MKLTLLLPAAVYGMFITQFVHGWKALILAVVVGLAWSALWLWEHREEWRR